MAGYTSIDRLDSREAKGLPCPPALVGSLGGNLVKSGRTDSRSMKDPLELS